MKYQFDMIFHYIKAAQNMVEKHHERYFDMIIHFNTAKNFIAEHKERDF